ncbi:transcription factor TFIIE beta subunit [Schizosaccharomyces japonicus yFS275]|uniref:Transcription initiation factor IIE subunit beta n=1 Tax=Schizosaccharomyces japonicus (strain yFS275 / FY16936) TaxID=402676 RepID=B6JXL9_SCHJY|nr:transcription factor TFIIE beta subunit [Schizosaccharomyces japonicus yFS275]EEB05163.1 transcription factor TFIIE beta subunit [Schizosaccharomyces japonicus yFS275]
MSSLSEQLSSFKKKVANQPIYAKPQIERPTAAYVASRSATPTDVSATSSPAPALGKKKRSKTNLVYSQPADSGVGTHYLSQLHYAVEYLKERNEPKTAEEIASYLSTPLTPMLLQLLKKNDRILYDARHETFTFKPLHNIRSSAGLLAYLDSLKVHAGMSVKELKDGWPNVAAELEELEKRGEVLLLRTKKDAVPKMVWRNDRSCDCHVDDEFKSVWHEIPIPPTLDLATELGKYGLKPTAVDPSTVKKKTLMHASKQKKPKTRRGKITNTHLNILRDYSSMKPS